jgi:hypothetical protein
MHILQTKPRLLILAFAISLFALSGCLTSAKLDKYVAGQYNNELPKPSKKKRTDIDVTAATPAAGSSISTSVRKTDKFLPLLVYWKFDQRQSCSLNPAIAVTNFTNGINAAATKSLTDKLQGRKLELTVQQVPSVFSIVTKENTIWLLYTFSWSRVYIEPDVKDLVVAYRLLEADKEVKAGSVTVKNTEKNKNFRYFQSWKSATSEYLTEYNATVAAMAKSVVTQLTQEL